MTPKISGCLAEAPPRPKAIVPFKREKDTRQRPASYLVEAIDHDGVLGAIFPGHGRLPEGRTILRHMHGAGGERITIVQMGFEIAAALHRMQDADDVPGEHIGKRSCY